MNILFYGNCQLYAIKQILNLQNVHQSLVECFTTDISLEEFDIVIKNSDVIITQHINDNYRNKTYLSTSYIVNNCKKNCIIIMVDSCYFDFYYPDLTYKCIDGTLLDKPSHYHYNKMIESYKQDLSLDYYIENYVNNINLYSKDELELIANNSLVELNRRYNCNVELYKEHSNMFIISTHEYIQNNYKDKLLFYSMNHPTKYVIQHICEKIINILMFKNTINYNLDVLDNTKCVLYKCIQNVVNFDINKELPLTSSKNTIKDIVKLYYESYKSNKIC